MKGLSQFDTESLQSLIEATAEENAGLPMIYQLVTAMQEWVTEKANELAAPARDPEAEIRKAREAEENRLAELRAHGTPVTPETFEAWRNKFEAELKLANSSLTNEPTTLVKPKLTGKAWFLQQEASHVDIIEPALEEDEEDGEGSRRSWSGDDENEDENESEDDFDLGSDDEDDVLDAYMSSAIPER